MNNLSFLKKFVRATLVVAILVGVSFSVAPKVHAQLAVANPDIIAQETMRDVIADIKTNLKDALISSLSAEMVNLLSMMAGQLAENTAVWVASGGNADSPIFSVTPPEDYFKYATANVLSEIYNEVVVDNFEDGMLPGLNLYLPTDPDVLLTIRGSIKEFAIAPEFDFEYPSIKNNWSSFLASLSAQDLEPAEKTSQVLAIMSEAFDPSVNEIAAVNQLQMHAITEAYSSAKTEEEMLIENDGFMAIEHYITGAVETSAGLVKAELEKSIEIQKELPFDVSTALLSNSDTLASIGMSAGTIFTNTLFSELMGKLQSGIFEDIVFDDSNPFDADSSVTYSRERIQEVFRSLTSFKPLEITDYSLLSEMATCPSTTRGSSPGLYNCAINSSFVSAIALSRAGSALSLQDAIDEGYIDSSWPLIPSADSARNQDSKCYTYGFCHSNLVKLRKARIIPIGWELATESDSNSETNPVTLQEVIDGFNSCNSDGELDDEHPWCHLIDPNWTLKFPETQCRTLAYGQILQGAGTSQRAQECVDIQSCVSEDENGNCDGGYGYCVREENTWQFRGNECPAHYASCMSFETEDGGNVDFLTNTIDYGNCSASNTGCLWYSSTKVAVDGDYDWPTINDIEADDLVEDLFRDRVYFNDEAEECSAEDGGCSELYERTTDVSLNLLANSSFETDDDENSAPDGWLISDASVYSADDTIARSGESAVTFSSSSEYAQRYGLVLNQTQYYTLSTYLAGTDGATGYLTMTFTDEDGTALDMSFQSANASCSGDDCYIGCEASGSQLEIEAEAQGSSFVRYECVFTTPTLTDRSLDIYATLQLDGINVHMDDIMLEQDSNSSTYAVGYSDSLSSVVLKLAPDYLGCTGASSDPDECANYAQMCSELEAGCGEYTPVNGDPSVTAVVSLVDQCPSTCDGYDTFRQEASAYEPFGDFPVYFIPESASTCSQTAVGCTEFTNLDTEALEYYTDLRSCIREDQARTNTAGDNAATFYTWEGSDEEGYQLKTWRLIESDLDSVTNYTYESGEVEAHPGFGPCSTWVSENDTISCDDDSDNDGVIDSATSTCDEHSDILTNPDCREFYDNFGEIHYRLWSETVTVNDECDSYRLTDLAGTDTSKREDTCEAALGYYDTSSDTCRFYGYADESTSCSSSQNGCREFTGGRSANSRVVLEDLFEEGTLANWDSASATTVTLSNESIAVDGHSIKSEGQNVWSYLYNNVSSCTSEDGCASSTGFLGGSCTVEFDDEYCGTLAGELYTNKTYTLTFWAKGNTDLEVGFDVGADPRSLEVDSLVDDAVPTLELSSEWAYYSVGPFDMNETDYADFGASSVLAFIPTDSTQDFYIDNITLREGEDELTLIKDSWSTPVECDMSWEGAVSPQFHLGCQEYTDQDGDANFLKSFRNLCDEDSIGCTAYYETQESDSEFSSLHNATCYNTDDGVGSPVQATENTSCYAKTQSSRTEFDTLSPVLCTIIAGETSCLFDADDWFIPSYIVSDEAGYPEFYHLHYGADAQLVKPDATAYLIYDESLACSSDAAGCTELGQPTISYDLTRVNEWTSVYIQNDPDEYITTLCSDDDLFCEAFESSTEGTWYFKDPIGHECEYKTDITVGGTSYSGWFREGTSEFCYGTGTCSELVDGASVDCTNDAQCAVAGIGECNITSGSYLIGGTESGIWRNGDVEFDGWVGHCSAEYDGCTAFEDPLDIDEDEFYGEADGEIYYYLDNDQIADAGLLSSQRCNGQVSQKQGCTLFYDNGDSTLDYNASATYVASAHADELLGEESYALVNPVDCSSSTTSTITLSDGSTFDPCVNRCLYPNNQLDGSYEAGVTDVYTVGQSCYRNDDCPSYEGYTGDMVAGFCDDSIEEIYIDGFTFASRDLEMPRLENDTNRVVSVNQDRVCSEWLACSSSYSIWDQDAGKYRTICDGIDLCTEYSAEGHPSFCSDWDANDPAVVLDIDKYVSRDTSWYGEEYSGYSVPDTLPIQYLEQINIAPPGYCEVDASSGAVAYATNGDGCSSDDDCGGVSGACVLVASEDYRLGYVAGSCSGEYADDCTIGYCSETGAACTEDGDCNGADEVCAPGVCYDISADSCDTDDDCSATQECLAGSCSTAGDYCDLDDLGCYDDDGTVTGETCFTSVAYKRGSCYGGQCFLAMDGEQYEDAEYEGQACRAHPEITSPFGNNIVSEWNIVNSGEVNPTSDIERALGDEDFAAARPRSLIAGFESVETCFAGEECVCSYVKASNSTGTAAYLEVSSSYLDESFLGVCSTASAVAGSICTSNDDCRTSDDENTAEGSATCDRVTNEDTLYGLEGYCLERDSGLNIEGDAYTGACLTWYPVDQLSGGTDLYAKYSGAGFFDDVYMCNYTSPYVMVGPSYASGSTIACAESDSSCSSSGNYSECADNAECPAGFFVAMGPCIESTATDTGTFSDECRESGDNDCPYVCVPEDSYTPEGESCYDIVTDGDFDLIDDDTRYHLEVWGYDISVGSFGGYDDQVEALASCAVHGVDITSSDFYDDILDYPASTDTSVSACDSSASDTSGYRCLYFNPIPYPACEELIQVSSATESYAWTDKLYMGGAISDSSDTRFDYQNDTAPNYFGASKYSPNDLEVYDPPVIVAACESTDHIVPPSSGNNFTVCDDDTYDLEYNEGTDPEDPASRSFIDFDYYYNPARGDYPESSDWSADSGGRESIFSRITSAFAKVDFGSLFTWLESDETYNYAYSEDVTGATAFSSYDEADVRGAEGEPPTVWAVDTDHCGSAYCEEGESSAITLNNQNSGNLESDEGFFRATVKFFAAAYKEQLPIRRVIVDWGDDEQTGSTGTDNYYKNHRGLVSGSLTESKCDTDDEWGMTSDSCDPNFFTYQHSYRCTAPDELTECDYDSAGNITNSPCQYDENTCAYRPRVHVRDNWGWCSGECEIGGARDGDGTNGCYDNSSSLSDPSDSASECAYETYPQSSGDSVDPWVYYDGYITVQE